MDKLKYNSIVKYKKLYDALIKELIEIGRLETIPSSTEINIRLRKSRGQISPSIKINDWDSFSTDDLKLLYIGLVLSEKELKWMDGSATKTARILRMLNERLDFEIDYQEIKELISNLIETSSYKIGNIKKFQHLETLF